MNTDDNEPIWGHEVAIEREMSDCAETQEMSSEDQMSVWQRFCGQKEYYNERFFLKNVWKPNAVEGFCLAR